MDLHDVRGDPVSVMLAVWLAVRVTVLALIAGRFLYGVVRFWRLPRAAKRHYPAAVWARWRWRWLTSNLGLTYVDRHRRAKFRLPVGTAVTVADNSIQPVKLRHPRARIRPDAHGLVATVRTVPGVGRKQFEDNAEHIANSWGCVRAQVSQPKPGRIIVRGLRTDPLTVPLAGAPAFGAGVDPAALRVYLGRDEWAEDRHLKLPGLTGITVAGLPGYGKTSFVSSLLCQLAGVPAQFVFIDGKGGGDYADWRERAWICEGDDLEDAAGALGEVDALMRDRFGTVLNDTGHRNAWHAGPSEGFPLIVTVIDECHTFFDLEAVRGDREAEGNVRACRALAGQLVKKGRSVLMLTVFITQKQTSDAIPTAIRDNCGFGVSFAVKTRDAAVAALGEQIRDYPSYCPTILQDGAYVGVCTASLRTGQDPFTRLRVPEVTEVQAAVRAADTAHLRRNPVLAAGSAAAPPGAAEPVSS